MRDRIVQALAATNGGPGLRAGELAAQLGAPRAETRRLLAHLVFEESVVTCGRDGRYKLGAADHLVMAG